MKPPLVRPVTQRLVTKRRKPLKKRALTRPDEPELSGEQQYAQQMVEKYGKEEAQKRIAQKAGYVSPPPSISTFLADPYYFQAFLGMKTDGTSNWRPYWVNALRTIYPSPYKSPFLEIVLTGCIGAGKSTAGLGGMAYDLCHMLHLRTPQKFYGEIGDSTRLVFALFNTTKKRAESVLYDQLITGFRESPFFREQLKYAGTPLNSISGEIKRRANEKERDPPIFPHRIDLTIGSRASDVIGDCVVGAILCELNFQTKVAKQAYDNYNQTRRRIISRFTNVVSYPGRLWLDSSRSDQLAFLESHIEQIAKDDRTILFSPALWEVKMPQVPYSGETFTVFVGDGGRDPQIISDESQLEGLDEACLLQVPIEHKQDFVLDLHTSIAELAGRTIRSEIKLIPSIEKINESLSLHSMVDMEQIEVDFFDKTQHLINYLSLNDMKKDGSARFLHIDLGIRRDRAAIACTKITGVLNSTRIDPTTNIEYFTRDPLYVSEWVMYLTPKPGHDIPIAKIQAFITDIRSAGFQIQVVSADGYQSENIRQNLTLQGFKCILQSVDKTREPYDLFKDALMEGRWHGPDNPILRQELKDLIDQGRKIDHPIRVYEPNGNTYRGSKDGSDAVAGSVFQASKNMDEAVRTHTIMEVLASQARRSAPRIQDFGNNIPLGKNAYDFVKQFSARDFQGGMLPEMPLGWRRGV